MMKHYEILLYQEFHLKERNYKLQPVFGLEHHPMMEDFMLIQQLTTHHPSNYQCKGQSQRKISYLLIHIMVTGLTGSQEQGMRLLGNQETLSIFLL